MPERVSAPFEKRLEQTASFYRFDEPITDHNRQKRCSTISARSSIFGNSCLPNSRLPDGRQKRKWADIAEVYLQINLEPQNYSLFKELLFSTGSAFYRLTGRSRTHTSAGEYADIRTNRQRQTCPNSIVSYFKLLDSGRVTAWLRTLRQGQAYCGGR